LVDFAKELAMQNRVAFGLVSLVAVAGCACGVLAQPAAFDDLGPVVVPAVPASTQESIDTSGAFAFGGEALTVRWFRFGLSNSVAGDLYVDISAGIFNQTQDLALALFDAGGALVASDTSQNGNFGLGSGLSFGSTAERTPPEFPRLRGQNGPSLASGTYWLALVAGTPSEVSIGASGWSATTPASYTLGFGDEETYVELGFFFGNTTPVPPPSNDSCLTPIDVAEDLGATPAFVGTTAGATQDGTSPCNGFIQGVTYKDVWFRYTPSQTGWVQIVASGTSDPSLSIYEQCGVAPVRCSGGGNFALVGGSRILYFATQGTPVLLATAGRAGTVGTVQLNIDPLGPACVLTPPAGTISEAEACGGSDNDGCNGGGFGTIAPGQTIAGTLYSTNNPLVRDRDWYRLTLTSAIQAELTVRGQAAMEAVIFGPPEQAGACSGRQLALARTADPLAPCVPATTRVILTPGEYFVAAAPLFGDGLGCDAGYSGYLLSLAGQACDQPTPTQQPANQTGAIGGTVSFTGSLAGSGDVTYTWQWGQVLPDTNPPFVLWSDMTDGEFSDALSLAEVSGAETGTLTIGGLDAALGQVNGGIRFRLKGQTCAPNFTEAATLTLLAACTPSDIAGPGPTVGSDGELTADDIIFFVSWFTNGDTRADIAGAGPTAGADGELTADDIILFISRFTAGC
jgi:hypothetical protein